MTLAVLWAVIDTAVALCLAVVALLLLGRTIEAIRRQALQRERARGQAILRDMMLGSRPAGSRVDLIRHAESVVQALSVIRGAEADKLVAALREAGLVRAMSRKIERQGAHADPHLVEAFAHIATDQDAGVLNVALSLARDADRRRVLVEALLRLGSPPPVGVAMQRLDQPGGPSSAARALIEAIAERSPEEALSMLGSTAWSSAAARAALVAGAGKSRRFTVIPTLMRLSESSDERLAVAAVTALGELGHPLAGAPILHSLYAENAAVRIAACRAASQLNLSGLNNALAERLDDLEWDVRFEASQALLSIGDEGRRALRRIADRREGRAAALAELALAEAA